jgi:acetyl esterase/lipase
LSFLALALCLGSARAAESELERALAAEVGQFVEADRVAPPSPCQVLFVGSSSIVKWKHTLPTDMAPIPVINRGFGGSHIEYINRWFDQVVNPYHPRAIVFYAGENDIDAGKSVDRVVADFDAFMAHKTQVLGATPVYFISIKPSKLRSAEFPLQGLVNSAIRARSAQRSDLHFIDVVSPMLENGRPKDIFEPDNLHMTRAGYVIWTQVVKAALIPNSDSELKECKQGTAAQADPRRINADGTNGTASANLVVDSEGVVHVRSMSVPFSSLASEQAKKNFIEQAPLVDSFFQKTLISGDIHEMAKAEIDDGLQRQAIEKWRAKFAVNVKQETFGGVQTNVIAPVAGVAAKNRRRVLINLHGGGFLFGAGRNGEILSGQAESIPISGLGAIEVVTVDYRQGPEHRFPAASEDVAAVYQELLKRHYPPKNIGIYGCSSGGWLTAEAVAWFRSHGLPRPGAVGIFGAGALVPQLGDSHYFETVLMGMPVLQASRAKELLLYFDVPSLKEYFDAPKLDIKDPLVSPVYSPTVLAAFPPSLLISGTRDIGLSSAVYTHSQLVKYGVHAELHVWEGATHCSFTAPTGDPMAPESREAWDVIVKFFDSYLGK